MGDLKLEGHREADHANKSRRLSVSFIKILVILGDAIKNKNKKEKTNANVINCIK